MNKKIILSSNSGWNIYNFRFGLVQELISDGYKVILICPEDKYVKQLVSIGCEHYNISIDRKGTSFYKDLKLFFRYLHLLKKIKPFYLFCYTIKPNIYASLAASFTSIKVINNITGLGTSFINKGLIKYFITFLYFISLRNSKKIFFQNLDDCNFFLKLNIINKNIAETIPGSGVNLKKFIFTPLLIKRENITFLFLGRMLWHKGIRELVEAAVIIKKKYPRTMFKFIGFIDEQNKSSISTKQIKKWEDQNIIKYLGAKDDVRPLIATSDCIILPSYREGMSKSLLEAAAMGRPIIATNVPGCKEIVKHGENGYICQSYSSKDLAKYIEKFILLNPDIREKFSKKSFELARENFDENIIIQKYLKVIKN